MDFYWAISAIGKLDFVGNLNPNGISIEKPTNQNRRDADYGCWNKQFLTHLRASPASDNPNNHSDTSRNNEYRVNFFKRPLIHTKKLLDNGARGWQQITRIGSGDNQTNISAGE